MENSVDKDSVNENKMGIGQFMTIIGLSVVLLFSFLSLISVSNKAAEAEEEALMHSYGFSNIEEAVDFNGNEYISAENNGDYYKVDVKRDANGDKVISAAVDVEKMSGGTQSVVVEDNYVGYAPDLTDFQKELVDKGWTWFVPKS